MHFFTSITSNYLPKARVLARSVRDNCRDSFFSVVLSDELPSDFCLENEPFDEILYIKDLDIPVQNLEMWIYLHTVVELCTAVKGAALVKFLNAGRSNKVIYLDPDTVVFDSLTELENKLDAHSIILTPHITSPEVDDRGILDNEICALQHGIYNLGFLAVRYSVESMRFASWWKNRLIDYCYDDIPRGLFTDQRWADMIPAMFKEVYIEKSPAYNVATWNLSTRKVTKTNGKYFINNYPLQFYHFSGFDSGANFEMMKQYGNSPELWELRDWYVQRQNEEGQALIGKTMGIYAAYSNGEVIPKRHRQLLRIRYDVQKYFGNKNPFVVQDECIYSWMTNEVPEKQDRHADIEELQLINDTLLKENLRFRKYLAPLLWVRRNLFKLRK